MRRQKSFPFTRVGVSDKRYLFYLLLHPDVRSWLAGKMDGSTGRQRLTKEVLSNYVIPAPPVQEQKQIAVRLPMLSNVQSNITNECWKRLSR